MKYAVYYSRHIETEEGETDRGFRRWIMAQPTTPAPTPEELEHEFGCMFKDDNHGLDIMTDDDILDMLFADLNIRPERYFGQARAREVGHTSISVGDVVALEDRFFQVMPFGFRRINKGGQES